MAFLHFILRTTFFPAFLGLFAAFFLFSACSLKPENSSFPNQKALNIALGDDVKTLDPANAYDSVSLTVLPLVLESLYEYAYLERPLRLKPLLAESMPLISPDKKKYTIKIKKGVFFQDDAAFPNSQGRELEAKDFVYQWKRLLHPKLHSNGSWIFEDKVVGYSELKKKLAKAKAEEIEKILMEPIEGFQIIDKYTIEIHLHRPYPQLTYVLAMGFCAPIAQEITKKYGHQSLNQRIVGTGPFMLKEFIYGSKIILEKNPKYRKELYPSEADAEAKALGLLAAAGKPIPFVDRIEFNIVKEDQPRWLLFNQGNLDTGGIPKDSFDTAVISEKKLSPELTAKGVRLKTYLRPVIFYLNFNMKDELLGKNVNLRRAIVHAVDRDYMIKTFLNGRGEKNTSIVPRGIYGHTSRKELIGGYDLEKAKAYLEKAGYPNGKGLPVIRLDLRGSSTRSRQEGEYFKRALAKIGVKLEVVPNTFPAFLEKSKNGNLQFFVGGWGADYPDPENFLQLLYSKNVSPGPNDSNWKNKRFDEIYLKTSLMPNSPKKLELIKEAEEIAFQKETVWSMLFTPVAYVLHHAWVKNYYPDEFLLNDLKYLDIDVEKRKKLKKEKF